MTATKRIKVRMAVTIEVDPEDWIADSGCDKDEVRSDIRSYFANHIGHAPAIEDASLTVRVS